MVKYLQTSFYFSLQQSLPFPIPFLILLPIKFVTLSFFILLLSFIFSSLKNHYSPHFTFKIKFMFISIINSHLLNMYFYIEYIVNQFKDYQAIVKKILMRGHHKLYPKLFLKFDCFHPSKFLLS